MSRIDLLRDFTYTSDEGLAAFCTPWVRTPSDCRHAELRLSCSSYRSGDAKIELHSSLDGTAYATVATDNLNAVESIPQYITSGLVSLVRIQVEVEIGGGPTSLVMSAYLLLRLAG